MGSLTQLISAFSDAIAPVINFLVWIFPLKVYRIRDGEGGVILSFGKVRRKRHIANPGLCIVFAFEEVEVVQNIGCYINLSEQTLMICDEDVVVINGCIEFAITDMKRAILEIEDIESMVEAISMNQIREYARGKTLVELQDSEKITRELCVKVNRKVKSYGVLVNSFMITDLRPHEATIICRTAKEIFRKGE